VMVTFFDIGYGCLDGKAWCSRDGKDGGGSTKGIEIYNGGRQDNPGESLGLNQPGLNTQ
jgi:hypothetical protein